MVYQAADVSAIFLCNSEILLVLGRWSVDHLLLIHHFYLRLSCFLFPTLLSFWLQITASTLLIYVYGYLAAQFSFFSFFFNFLRIPRSAGGKYICYYLINLKSMEATGIISSRFDDGLAPSLFNIGFFTFSCSFAIYYSYLIHKQP